MPWTAGTPNESILKETNLEYSLRRADAEAETPKLWLLDFKSQLIGKDADAGKV